LLGAGKPFVPLLKNGAEADGVPAAKAALTAPVATIPMAATATAARFQVSRRFIECLPSLFAVGHALARFRKDGWVRHSLPAGKATKLNAYGSTLRHRQQSHCSLYLASELCQYLLE
jgi:hypothetical protein